MEKVQQRATNMINVLGNAGTGAERMMKWELFSLEERWLGGELTEIFKLPVGYYKIKLEGEFEIFWQTRNKGGRIKYTLNKWPRRSLGYTSWLQEMPTSGNCSAGFVLQRVGTRGLWTLLVGAEGSISDSISNKLPSGQWDCSVQIMSMWRWCLDPKWTSQFLANRTDFWGNIFCIMGCPALNLRLGFITPKGRQGTNFELSTWAPTAGTQRGRETASAELHACPKAGA